MTTTQRILTYPHLLNPVAWLAVIIILIYFICFGWWSCQIVPHQPNPIRNFNFYFNRNKRIRTARDLFQKVCTMVINTFWYNARKAKAYAAYLTSSCIHYHPFNDWRTQKAIDSDLKYYQSLH